MRGMRGEERGEGEEWRGEERREFQHSYYSYFWR
jgi:hypothetical protein